MLQELEKKSTEETMDMGLSVLSEITVFNKYAKFLPKESRRETWQEIVDRYEIMMLEKYPNLTQEIKENITWIRKKKVLPSMRALQFAGKPIALNNTRLYNCCFLPIDHYKGFSELMFLLLSGTGVGYSVQFADIEKLPEIRKPLKERRFLIGDSIEGWADAIKALMKSYFTGQPKPKFDFRDIRPKGANLITAGGKAPGPDPLKLALIHIETILNNKQDGEKLTSVECHDICCHIANSVLAGGIRRAAMIALFSFDDEDMLSCKSGNWWELNEQRGRANNSAVVVRNRINKTEFLQLWKKIELSNSGEPGISWTNNAKWGFNPCHEVSLRPFQYCNLCEINASNVESQEDFNERCRVAAFFGTLQAGFTDFHYLRDIWKKTTEKDALIGVGMTGIASGAVLKLNLKEGVSIVKKENEKIAGVIGINKAARTTVIKPSGCMVPETEIKTSVGDISLEKLFELNNYSLNDFKEKERLFLPVTEKIYVKDLNNEDQLITQLYVNGVEPVYEITLEDNTVIKCTGNHQVMTQRGWVRTDELLESDEVKSF